MPDDYERYILYLCDEAGDATFDCWYPDAANAEYDIAERDLSIAMNQPMNEVDGSKSLILYAIPSIITTK